MMKDKFEIYHREGIDRDVFLYGENICRKLEERFPENWMKRRKLTSSKL